MQGVIREVDQAIAIGVFDERFLDVPFPRDGPVEYLRARRDLVNLQRDALADPIERLSKTVAGDAPANGVELFDELIHALSCICFAHSNLDPYPLVARNAVLVDHPAAVDENRLGACALEQFGKLFELIPSGEQQNHLRIRDGLGEIVAVLDALITEDLLGLRRSATGS